MNPETLFYIVSGGEAYTWDEVLDWDYYYQARNPTGYGFAEIYVNTVCDLN